MPEERAERARRAATERFAHADRMTAMTGLAERLSAPGAVAYPGTHLGLRWRPLIPSDGPAIARLIRESEDVDHAVHRASAQEIADMLEGGALDTMDTIIGLDADSRVSALASVRVLHDTPGVAVAVVNAVVSPHWRGRGIGRALLFWQDGRARQLLLDVFGADTRLPAMITNVVDGHATDRRRLYIAAGFYARRTFQVMYRELEGSEIPLPVRGGYRIVPWSDVPLESLRNLHMEVFRDHFWPQMRGRWWSEAVGELDERWSFAAVSSDGTPVGYAAVGRPAERWIAEGRTEAYVSLLGVSGPHRGSGLASGLLGAAIAAAARSGVSRIGLDVDVSSSTAAHAIYEHLGFVDERSLIYYTIDH